jgi:hypothetical protein
VRTSTKFVFGLLVVPCCKKKEIERKISVKNMKL